MIASDFLKFSNNSEEKYASQLIGLYIEENQVLQDMIIASGMPDYPELILELAETIDTLTKDDLVKGARRFAIKEKRQKEINFLDVLRFLKVEGSPLLGIFEEYGVVLSELESYLKGEKELQESDLYSLNKKFSCKKEHFVERNDLFLEIIKNINHLENNNVLLFGKEGTGKSTVKEFLDEKISKDYKIQKLEALDLFTKVKSFGEFEETIKNNVQLIKEKKEKTILVIDDYHHLVDSGVVKSADIFFNFFKNELKNNLISFFIIVSESYYKKIKNKDYTKRFFNTVEVSDMTHKETKEHILKRLKDFTDHYKKEIDESQLEYIIENSINYKALSNPEKVSKIIDQLLSYSEKTKASTLEIDKILSKFGKNQNNSKEHDIDDLNNFIKNKVFGQDEAIKTVLDEISIYLAGYKEENKPIGSFLFLGQTGVGKTELARQLKKSFGLEDSHFLRFDMSEFKEKQSIAKLIGAPPGYIGFDSSSTLSDKMSKISDDVNILLFDEIEKAHDEVLDLMLQMMEDGRLTDSKGNTANFTKSIIILTSNQGAQTASVKNIGLAKSNVNKSKAKKEIENYFKAELLNRLSATVYFNNITKENSQILKNIALRHIKEMVQEKGHIKIHVSDDVIEKLITEGYNEKYGARNLKKVIRDNLLKKISLEVLRNKPKEINIKLDNNEIVFN